MDREINWAILATGLSVLAIVAIVGAFLAGGGYGVWLVALLPIGIVASGAVVLAGREP